MVWGAQNLLDALGRGGGPFEEVASTTFATFTAEALEDCPLALPLPLPLEVLSAAA